MKGLYLEQGRVYTWNSEGSVLYIYSKLIDTRTVRTVLSIQYAMDNAEPRHGELPYHSSQRKSLEVRSTMVPVTGVETSL